MMFAIIDCFTIIIAIKNNQSINRICFSIVNLDYLSDYCIKIPLYLENTNHQFSMLYDTVYSQTSITNMGEYPNSTTESSNTDSVYYSLNKNFIHGDEVFDYFNLQSIDGQYQPLHFIKSSRHSFPHIKFKGILGSGRNYTTDASSQYYVRFSYLHYFYNNKLISRRIFSRFYYSNKDKAEVFFASISPVD